MERQKDRKERETHTALDTWKEEKKNLLLDMTMPNRGGAEIPVGRRFSTPPPHPRSRRRG